MSESESNAARNKAIVLEAFDTLFNRRDYAAAESFWSPTYVQHSAHIPPGPFQHRCSAIPIFSPVIRQ